MLTASIALSSTSVVAEIHESELLESLRPAARQAAIDAGNIPEERQLLLRKAALYVQSKQRAGEPAHLTFICTHNSRRSHISQAWAQAAAAYYGIPNVHTYSGGTEATAFNPRAVKALRDNGFLIEGGEGQNPVYTLKYGENQEALKMFSKVYSSEPNPKNDFAAIMTCTSADKACPLVQGAAVRIAIPYEDPKAADNTPEEVARYAERSRQIAAEMFFLMSQVK